MSNSVGGVKRLVFWEPSVSPHKAALLAELARQNPMIEVVCCAQRDIAAERRALGWTVPPPDGYERLVRPGKEKIQSLIHGSLDSTFHVFSGIRWVPVIVEALAEVKRVRARYAVMSEPRDGGGWSGKLRLIHSLVSEGYHRRHAKFVLAIGRNGPSWFRSAMYRSERIFPYAYFVEPPKTPIVPAKAVDRVRIGYLGRFVKEKGIFDLIAAVHLLGTQAELILAGSGPEEIAMRKEASLKQIDMRFLGVLPITEVSVFFSMVDVVVLASTSKNDGWGVVVSEALLNGIPVIATSEVGASLVVEKKEFGRLVRKCRPGDIAAAIISLRDSGAFSSCSRLRRSEVAKKILSPEAGAKKLMEVIGWSVGDLPRPDPFYMDM
ncbi:MULTISPECIES: glycosyltransferase [Cupriavidus]